MAACQYPVESGRFGNAGKHITVESALCHLVNPSVKMISLRRGATRQLNLDRKAGGRHGSFSRRSGSSSGMMNPVEHESLLQYCEQLDNQNSGSGGNHANIILPLIKDMPNDCLKWKHSLPDSFLDNLKEESKRSLGSTPSFLPSSSALIDLADALMNPPKDPLSTEYSEHLKANKYNSTGRGAPYPWQKNTNNSSQELVKESDFRTAAHQLRLNQVKHCGGRGGSRHGGRGYLDDRGAPGDNTGGLSASLYGNTERRSLGTRPGAVSGKFVPPVRRGNSGDNNCGQKRGAAAAYGDSDDGNEPGPYDHMMADPRFKNIDSKMVELIMNEVLDTSPDVHWDDIAGLLDAKATIQEAVVWPMLRPDIFSGLRGPPKGVLLFGPPGTGKTMIGKAIASQSGATFFSISASSVTSKWVGEGEKMVRALFAVARVKSPSVIFIDEIDSLLCQRSDTEHESSRRIKTEFLVQLDGVGTLREQVLVVGATNRPQELDEAARRRLVKRLYIPLPDQQNHTLTATDMSWVATETEGFSGADVAALCSEAAMGPVRAIDPSRMRHIALDQVRPIGINDFRKGVSSVRPSVCQDELKLYTEWNCKYGITRAAGP
ncbi:hypothetical protein HAZT_HAZT008950 [Hyalella azteca]|uniref:AAA+ ATPase domain-containing protein n=1 Tax=Hyalella azteca TaxID=294128 RepID=A0A6A0GSQ5_HYAAZ|nr:hypothetical protein HAZT_HAZT008950 [Hyalella azteca]